MYQEAFRHIKNLNLQTELLEALEWDQDAVDEFNDWFVNCLNASYTPDALLQNVTTVWGEDIVQALKATNRENLLVDFNIPLLHGMCLVFDFGLYF